MALAAERPARLPRGRQSFRNAGVLIQLEGRACGHAYERDAGDYSDDARLEAASAGFGMLHGMPSLATRRTT